MCENEYIDKCLCLSVNTRDKSVCARAHNNFIYSSFLNCGLFSSKPSHFIRPDDTAQKWQNVYPHHAYEWIKFALNLDSILSLYYILQKCEPQCCYKVVFHNVYICLKKLTISSRCFSIVLSSILIKLSTVLSSRPENFIFWANNPTIVLVVGSNNNSIMITWTSHES